MLVAGGMPQPQPQPQGVQACLDLSLSLKGLVKRRAATPQPQLQPLAHSGVGRACPGVSLVLVCTGSVCGVVI